jgi:hypothetical protein
MGQSSSLQGWMNRIVLQEFAGGMSDSVFLYLHALVNPDS